MRRVAVVALTLALIGLRALPSMADDDVIIDLLAIPPGTEATVAKAPLNKSFPIRLGNRAPGVRYRVTVKDTGREFVRNVDLPYESLLRLIPDRPDCDVMQRLWLALLKTTQESEVPARVEAIRRDAETSACSLKSFVENRVDQSRPPLGNFNVSAGADIRLRIERLAADSNAVERQWQVVVTAARHTPGWAQATEEEWVVADIARDLSGMATFAKAQSLPGPAAAFSVTRVTSASGSAPAFRISVPVDRGAPVTHVTTIAQHLWSPRDHAPFAQALLQRLGLKASSKAPEPGPSALAALTDCRAEVIEAQNQRVSRWLARDMTSAAAHEDAAVVLASLALNEASGYFHDRRSILSRLTAHLAMAEALRGGAPAGPSGRYAEIALLTNVARQQDVLDRLAGDGAKPSAPEERAWANALRMRTTGDWRVLAKPVDGTLLERREHFRALGASLSPTHALAFLEGHKPEPIPDWGRIALQWGVSVEVGSAFAPVAIEGELKEFDQIQRLLGRPPLGTESLVAALSVAPAREVARVGAKTSPRVIDEGTWSRFYQRHLLHAATMSEAHLRSRLGLTDEADRLRAALRERFGALLLFPLMAARWQAAMDGPPARPQGRPGPHDTCGPASRVVREDPVAISVENWQLLEAWCPDATEEGQLPALLWWFAPPIPTGTAFEAANRLRMPTLSRTYDMPKLEALLKLAPFVPGVAHSFLSRIPPDKPEPVKTKAVLEPMVAFDLWAMGANAKLLEADAAAYRQAYEPICRLDPDRCFVLADYLADRNMDDAAAEVYERTIKEARDRVGVSGQVGWLIDYHFDRGRQERAMELAQMAADVYSGSGLSTMGRLLERMGRYREAESYYGKIAERYGNDTSRDQFYVRYEQRVGDGRYRAEAAQALQRLFPGGLQRVRLGDFNTPAPVGGGYWMPANPGFHLEQMGLREADVVVAIDGFRVQTRDQYVTVRGFTDAPELALIVFRQGRFLEFKGTVRRPPFGPTGSSKRAIASNSE